MDLCEHAPWPNMVKPIGIPTGIARHATPGVCRYRGTRWHESRRLQLPRKLATVAPWQGINGACIANTATPSISINQSLSRNLAATTERGLYLLKRMSDATSCSKDWYINNTHTVCPTCRRIKPANMPPRPDTERVAKKLSYIYAKLH
jgi:hypothetical protein